MSAAAAVAISAGTRGSTGPMPVYTIQINTMPIYLIVATDQVAV